MLYLTRFLVEMLAPLNLSILVLIFAFLLLLIGKKGWSGLLLFSALFLQLFFGYGILVKQQIAEREQSFPALTKEKLAALNDLRPKFIVVLGSGNVSDSRLPENSQIDGASLYRLVEGVRLLRLFPEAKLVISGGIAYDPTPNADLVKKVAEQIGVAPEKIITENRPRDTVEEAKYLAPVLQKDPFLLVTSALHMPRAMAIFKGFGLDPTAAPTNYVMKNHVVEPPGGLFPSSGNLEYSRKIIYEWLGTVWSRIKAAV